MRKIFAADNVSLFMEQAGEKTRAKINSVLLMIRIPCVNLM